MCVKGPTASGSKSYLCVFVNRPYSCTFASHSHFSTRWVRISVSMLRYRVSALKKLVFVHEMGDKTFPRHEVVLAHENHETISFAGNCVREYVRMCVRAWAVRPNAVSTHCQWAKSIHHQKFWGWKRDPRSILSHWQWAKLDLAGFSVMNCVMYVCTYVC